MSANQAWEPSGATGAGRGLATAWLVLGIAALAIAGLFAILLVVARTPLLHGLFPAADFFRVALVVHVNQSVLIWFLAFAGVLWSLLPGGPARPRAGWVGLAASVGGCGLLAVAPGLGAGGPLLNNYVPVLQHPLFFAAIALFAAGVLVQSAAFLRQMGAERRGAEPLSLGMVTVAAAFLLSCGTLIWTWSTLPGHWQGQPYYEYLFWGAGHTLQFAYTQLMLVAWLWLARACGIPIGLSDRWVAAILVLGVAPLALVPLLLARHAPDSAESLLAFTRLMQLGNGLAAVPLGLAILLGLARGRSPAPAGRGAPFGALVASLLLFAVGGVLGALIVGVNTVIPAHYHGSIVGVTLALMGLTYQILPRLGYAAPLGRMATWQPWVYAGGQLLHVGGLAASGAMGIQRKTAGSAQVLEGWAPKAAMGVMGLGGLLAVAGGILFVVVVTRSLARRRDRPGAAT